MFKQKRWKKESTVSRLDIQTFVGIIVGKQASKGVFITTAKFSHGAIEYANSIDKRVIFWMLVMRKFCYEKTFLRNKTYFHYYDKQYQI
ncbi:restriction endonuclease [Neobacillus niacini]|uniref:restriction endonuclease n=1 Tax=Neobacillus niacini TaxID=86668 RepID=UPI003B589BBB